MHWCRAAASLLLALAAAPAGGAAAHADTSPAPVWIQPSDKPGTSPTGDVRVGCDAVSVDGFECGGHPGEDDVPNFILLPRAAEELKIPFVASGGMADGRSLVAALALGADGINMGTRFIATKEAPVHDHVKQALVDATELDTRLVMRPLRNTERVLRNAAVERVLEKEHALGSAITFADVAPELAGVYPRIMQGGEMDAGAWSCAMVAGRIHDVPPVRVLIEGDGQTLADVTLQRGSKDRGGPVPLVRNVKDVKKLRVVVTHDPTEFLDLGLHVDLADAFVSK